MGVQLYTYVCIHPIRYFPPYNITVVRMEVQFTLHHHRSPLVILPARLNIHPPLNGYDISLNVRLVVVWVTGCCYIVGWRYLTYKIVHEQKMPVHYRGYWILY